MFGPEDRYLSKLQQFSIDTMGPLLWVDDYAGKNPTKGLKKMLFRVVEVEEYCTSKTCNWCTGEQEDEVLVFEALLLQLRKREQAFQAVRGPSGCTITTPHMDTLASKSLVFERAYCQVANPEPPVRRPDTNHNMWEMSAK